MNNAEGRDLPGKQNARETRSVLRRLWQRRSDLFIPAILLCGLVLLATLLGGMSLNQATGEIDRPDRPTEPGGFPNLGYQVRSHWIEGKTLYYIKDEAIAVRDIETGNERTIPFGPYEVKSLIAKGNEIALTAKTKETFRDHFRGRIRFLYDMGVYDGFRFTYDQENDVYNGIVCRLDTSACKVAISGNYLMRDFQPYSTGYVFSKTEWEDFSLGADIPLDVRSSVVVVKPDGQNVPSKKFGGIQSLFVSENGNFVDIRNASDLTFKSGEGIYRWSGGDVHPIKLVGLEPDRYRDFNSGQLRTNGFHWAISYYNVEKGEVVGLSSEYFCQNRLGKVDSKSALFFIARSISYVDNQLKLVVLDCRAS